MKSGFPRMGNIKMRGRLCMLLSCGCCEGANFKWRERLREAAKEVADPDAPWELDLLAAELGHFEEAIPWCNGTPRRWAF